VGLCSLLGAIAAGAREVVAVDLADDKLAFARQLGASATFSARDPDCVEQIRQATRGGVEFAFEMAGSVKALELAYGITRRGGTTITAGLPNPAATMAFAPVGLVAEERTLKGSYIGTCVPMRDIPRYIQLYRRGKLPVDRLLSERIRLEDINEGFDRLRESKAIRQIVLF
jgi:alcohol dehydrogenase